MTWVDAVFDHDLALGIWPPFCFRRNVSSCFVWTLPVTPFQGVVWGGHLPNTEMLSKYAGQGALTQRHFAPSLNPPTHDIFLLFSKLFWHLANVIKVDFSAKSFVSHLFQTKQQFWMSGFAIQYTMPAVLLKLDISFCPFPIISLLRSNFA